MPIPRDLICGKNTEVMRHNAADRYQVVYRAVKELYETLESLGEKLPPYLVGLAGEFLVKSKLTQNGIPFSPRGGQAGYDILLLNRSSDNRVEVRSSLLKNEGIYSDGIMFYGWRLQNIKEENIAYDYLVCVALGKGLRNPRFFLFRKDEVEKADDVRIGRFRNMRKKLHLFRTLEEMKRATNEKSEIVSEWERKVNRNIVEYENRWKILK